MLEVAQDAAALGVVKRCAFGDIDGKLDLAVRRVDALAARTDDFAKRSARSAAAMTAPSGIPGPGAIVRSFMPPSLGALQPFLVSAEAETASRRTGFSLSIILVAG